MANPLQEDKRNRQPGFLALPNQRVKFLYTLLVKPNYLIMQMQCL